MDFLKQFLQIKKIIALLTTLVFCYLAVVSKISSTEFLSVFTLIVGFYFGQSSARQVINENKKQRINYPIVEEIKAINNDSKPKSTQEKVYADPSDIYKNQK